MFITLSPRAFIFNTVIFLCLVPLVASAAVDIGAGIGGPLDDDLLECEYVEVPAAGVQCAIDNQGPCINTKGYGTCVATELAAIIENGGELTITQSTGEAYTVDSSSIANSPFANSGGGLSLDIMSSLDLQTGGDPFSLFSPTLIAEQVPDVFSGGTPVIPTFPNLSPESIITSIPELIGGISGIGGDSGSVDFTPFSGFSVNTSPTFSFSTSYGNSGFNSFVTDAISGASGALANFTRLVADRVVGAGGTPGLADFIQNFESFELTAYRDGTHPDGTPRWSIGYGTVSSPGEVITQAEAEARFQAELERFATGVDAAVQVPLTENQRTALISFAYNVGLGPDGFDGSTLLRKLNSGDYDSVGDELARWVNSDGKTLAGLVNRRAQEANLFDGYGGDIITTSITGAVAGALGGGSGETATIGNAGGAGATGVEQFLGTALALATRGNDLDPSNNSLQSTILQSVTGAFDGSTPGLGFASNIAGGILDIAAGTQTGQGLARSIFGDQIAEMESITADGFNMSTIPRMFNVVGGLMGSVLGGGASGGNQGFENPAAGLGGGLGGVIGGSDNPFGNILGSIIGGILGGGSPSGGTGAGGNGGFGGIFNSVGIGGGGNGGLGGESRGSGKGASSGGSNGGNGNSGNGNPTLTCSSTNGQISIEWNCQNGAIMSEGFGFLTNGQSSGTATFAAPDTDAPYIMYEIQCGSRAQSCQVDL